MDVNATLWSPPSGLEGSPRLVRWGRGWALLPPSLPPVLDLAEVGPFAAEAARVLERLSQRFQGEDRTGVGEAFLALGTTGQGREVERMRQEREPWRAVDVEHRLSLAAQGDLGGAIEDWIEPEGLAAAHQRLFDQDDLVAQRFAEPGRLRESAAVLSRSDGGIETVLAPADRIRGLLHETAQFFRGPEAGRWPAAVTAAILHYQIVAIHPFLDGNGRVARWMAEQWLIARGAVSPGLPLHLIFRRHYPGYLRRLAGVTIDENWNKWVRFFCAAVAQETAQVLNRQEIFA